MGFKNRFLLRRSTRVGAQAGAVQPPGPEALGAIVIAESDSRELEHLAAIVAQMGYQVFKAEDGETALRLARDRKPSLVMACLDLAGIDGYMLCQQLRQGAKTERIPFMFLCPQGKHPDKMIGHETYAHDYVQKPFSVEELKSRVQALLRRSRKEAAPRRPSPRRAPGDPIDEYLQEFREGKGPRAPAEAAVAADGPALPVSQVPVTEAELSQDLPESQVPLYREAELYVQAGLEQAAAGRAPDLHKGLELAKALSDSLAGSSELLLAAAERTPAFRVTAHCVNVAVVALKVATALGYDRERLEKLGLAALLHEIGAVRIPRQVWHKSELNRQEQEMMRMRPAYGAEILRRLGSDSEWLAAVVEQVGEKEDGSGPRGLSGSDLPEESKVLGLVDAFEEATHDRPSRQPVAGHQALFDLSVKLAGAFPEALVRALLRSLSVFPYNQYVILSNGEIGRVVEINAADLRRPRIEVVGDEAGRRLSEKKEIDLALETSLDIMKAITADQLPWNDAGRVTAPDA